jgi:hypothetical protein
MCLRDTWRLGVVGVTGIGVCSRGRRLGVVGSDLPTAFAGSASGDDATCVVIALLVSVLALQGLLVICSSNPLFVLVVGTPAILSSAKARCARDFVSLLYLAVSIRGMEGGSSGS